jgi:hypothetical protein
MSNFLIPEAQKNGYANVLKPRVVEKLSKIEDKQFVEDVMLIITTFEKTTITGEKAIEESKLEALERDTACVNAIEAFTKKDTLLASLQKEIKGSFYKNTLPLGLTNSFE